MWINGSDNLSSEMFLLYGLVAQLIGRSSIFYYNPNNLDCDWQLIQRLNFSLQPQWVWNSEAPFVRLKERHTNDLFVLACLPDSFDINQLAGLSKSLTHLRHVFVLIELSEIKRNMQFEKDSLAAQILLYFHKSAMLNVALYYQQLGTRLILYRYSAFPRFKLLQRQLTKYTPNTHASVLYPDQLNNLKGYTIRVMTDLTEPYSFLYRDENGESQASGLNWYFIKTYAKKLGAKTKVVLPTWQSGRSLAEPHMLEYTKNGSIDFGLTSAMPGKRFSSRYYQYTYPIVFGSWCIMLPLESSIYVSEMFKRIIEVKAQALLLVIFACWCLLCYLSDTACLHSLSLIPRLLVLIVFCACQAQLFSLLAMCPMQKPIDSFDTLLNSNLRIFGVRSEIDSLPAEFHARYSPAFRLTSNLTEFYELRNNFNTSWGYPITAIKWSLLKEQQKYFERPLFRYSKLCLIQFCPFSFLIDEESIYRASLMMYSLRCHESGLFLHWVSASFLEMVRADRMKLKDYSKVDGHLRQLQLQDLEQVGIYFCSGLLLALIVFIYEVLSFYVNVWLDNL